MSEALMVREPERVQLDVEIAKDMLARCLSVHEAKAIHDRAKAIAVYQRERNASIEAQNLALEIARRAERCMGEFLVGMPKAKGASEPGTRRGTQEAPRQDSSETLADIGVTKKQSATWQRMAKLPEPVFEDRIAELKMAQAPITVRAVLRDGEEKNAAESEPVARRHTGGRTVDHEARRQRVMDLHKDGKRSVEIAEITGMHSSMVSKYKMDLGIAEASPHIRLWSDVEHAVNILTGAVPQIEKLAAAIVGSRVNASKQEISSCKIRIVDIRRALLALHKGLETALPQK